MVSTWLANIRQRGNVPRFYRGENDRNCLKRRPSTPRKPTCPLKRDHVKRTSIFMEYVSFQGGNIFAPEKSLNYMSAHEVQLDKMLLTMALGKCVTGIIQKAREGENILSSPHDLSDQSICRTKTWSSSVASEPWASRAACAPGSNGDPAISIMESASRMAKLRSPENPTIEPKGPSLGRTEWPGNT